MKVALYVVDGTTQIVLTPETEWERNAAKMLMNHQGQVRVFEGEFYECRGGWYRHGYGSSDRSVILRLDAPHAEDVIPGEASTP